MSSGRQLVQQWKDSIPHTLTLWYLEVDGQIRAGNG